MTLRIAIGLAVLVVLGFILLTVPFIVTQTEQAIVVQFGEPIRVVEQPGLQFKTPWQSLIVYDRRVLDFELPSEKLLAADQKQMVVDTYTRFRIVNPLQFYQTVGTEEVARTRLGAVITDRLRRFVANFELIAVISDKRSSIMRQIRDDVNTEAKGFGIDVIDVRIRRADLPDDNSKAIYARMIAERQREAAQFRAQGAQQAQEIRANADRQRVEIIADSQKQSQILSGEGDADSIRIYAEAFGVDKDFFSFYRSLQAYKDALAGSGTTLVLSPDSEFFRYFEALPRGTTGAGAAPPAQH
ncbi:MAG: protease modulator HflC [Stellaceae bacterium]